MGILNRPAPTQDLIIVIIVPVTLILSSFEGFLFSPSLSSGSSTTLLYSLLNKLIKN